ncbi:MAG: Spy/CpxP family protein refolding chaperone [Armatimonas sp.]
MTTKTLFLGTLAGVSLLSLTSAAFAQDPAAPAPAKRAGRAQGAGRQGGSGLTQLDAGLRAANLTPEQLAAIKTLAQKFRDDVFAKLTPEQQEKVKAAMVAGPGAGRAGAGARQGRSPFVGMLADLNLTAEQKTKIDPIVTEATKKLADTMRDARQGGKGSAQDARQAMQNIVNDTKGQICPLLTPEQQTKLDAYQPPARGAGQGRARKNGGATPPATGGGAFGNGN